MMILLLELTFQKKKTGSFRLIFCKDSFMDVIGSGNGLPHQILELI